MDEKLKEIENYIKAEIPDCNIEYQQSGTIHKFRVNWTPTHWLYLSSQFVDDNNIKEIIEAIQKQSIMDIFKKCSKSKWLFLSHKGLREVDENFTKSTT